jgi:NADH-quinone oxidoreductase subunit G
MVKGESVEWRTAIAIAAEMLKAHASDKIGLIASARATNEELFLVRRLVGALGIDKQHDIVPRIGESDGLLVAADPQPRILPGRNC